MEENLIEQLKKLIKLELQNCNQQMWPKVCELQSTEIGYLRLEEMIIRFVGSDGMDIGSAIALIEQELSHAD